MEPLDVAGSPGQYFDSEAELHYNYFRDYEPGTGRYIESDPIGLWGGINTFSYVFNGPINWTDPSGLKVRMSVNPALSSDPSPAIVPDHKNENRTFHSFKTLLACGGDVTVPALVHAQRAFRTTGLCVQDAMF